MQLKQQLYNHCHQHIKSSIAAAQNVINNAREASQNETKSSAGDKYETGREMMQQEIDMAMQRISELQKLKASLDRIDPALVSKKIQPGSVALTSQGSYYIAISMGKTIINGNVYYIISPASPLGSKLIGTEAGDTIAFNGKEFTVNDVI